MEYQIFEPGTVDEVLFQEVCQNHNLDPNSTVSMLPFGAQNMVGQETRRLFFGLAVGRDGLFFNKPELNQIVGKVRDQLITTRIFSFGSCNVACPYCKRDCQFVDDDGNIIIAVDVTIRDLFALAEGSQSRGEVVRFSGGDPVMFPKQTLAIGEYMWRKYGVKVSIAHNGSGPAWVRKLAPYLSSAAIDLKAIPSRMGEIMGIEEQKGRRMFDLSQKTQAHLSEQGVIMDIRTPIFGDTSLEDMMLLADAVSKNNPRTTFWTWRLYKAVEGCDWEVPEKERVFEMLDQVSRAHPEHWMGVRAKWEGGGMMYWLSGQRLTPMSMDDIEQRGSGNKLAA